MRQARELGSDLVRTTRTLPLSVHQRLTDLIPGGVPRHLSADMTARALRRIRPTDLVATRRRKVVVELLAELPVLDRKRKTINAELDQTLADYGTCLTEIDGIGRVAAATIIAIVGDVRRFPTSGHTSPRSPAPHPSPSPPETWCATA